MTDPNISTNDPTAPIFTHQGFEYNYVTGVLADEKDIMWFRPVGATVWLLWPEGWPEPPTEVLEHFFGPLFNRGF